MEGVIENLVKSSSVQTSKLHDHILKAESSSKNLNATKSTIHLVQELRSFESEYKSIVNKLPKDCSTVEGPPGIYLISPGESEPILASCESGWTTVQAQDRWFHQLQPQLDEYSSGPALDRRALINMKDIYGKCWQANYEDFRVADYAMGFKLHIGKYAGNASDAFDYQNSMEFSTVESDRDISNRLASN
ncbi:hypothetical protein JTB14_018634 [Gonioctena quinquepunctata]|nr:hypothetical protein JTB14_018634 [Gonioctena quinquepunctata]